MTQECPDLGEIRLKHKEDLKLKFWSKRYRFHEEDRNQEFQLKGTE